MEKGKYNILIVDDIFVNRLLLSEIIKKIGYNFTEAKNGKEAVDFLKTKDYDMVLMDIEMPVMNGLETTRFIRDKFEEPKNNIPIVAITAYNPSDFFDEFKSAGFDGLITKPYLRGKISKVINKFCVKNY
ncbi:MAG: response regulator [Bacteroidetes bacterium]|nr:MAG: response regulator [Bacteroidota bacterium]